MRKTHVITSIVITFVFLGVLIVAFWAVAGLFDRLAGFQGIQLSRSVELILTGMVWSLGLFWIFWAYSYLLFVGHGSPVEAFGLALEPTKRLVTAGPYAYVRNPMLFGLLILLLGLAFFMDSISGLLLVPIVAILAALYLRAFEEKELLRRFAQPYEQYRHHVPMLIPLITPYIPPETAHRA